MSGISSLLKLLGRTRGSVSGAATGAVGAGAMMQSPEVEAGVKDRMLRALLVRIRRMEESFKARRGDVRHPTMSDRKEQRVIDEMWEKHAQLSREIDAEDVLSPQSEAARQDLMRMIRLRALEREKVPQVRNHLTPPIQGEMFKK